MKKLLAAALLFLVGAWAFYLYGRTDSSDARSGVSAAYQSDPKLADLVQDLARVKSSLRSQLELLEHDRKKSEARPRSASSLSSSPLRDPFSPAP